MISLDSEEEEEDEFMTFLRDLDMQRDHRRKRARSSTHTHPIPIPTRDAPTLTSAEPLGRPPNLNQPSKHQSPIVRTARASLGAANGPAEGPGEEQARPLHDFLPSFSSPHLDQDADILMPPLGSPASPQLEMFSPPKPKRQRHADPDDAFGGDSAIPVLAGSSLQDEVDKMSASDAARLFQQDAARRRASKAGFRPQDSRPFSSVHASDAEMVDAPPASKAQGSGPVNRMHASDAELVDGPTAEGNVLRHSITGGHVKPAEQAAAKGLLLKHSPNRVWEGFKQADLTARTVPRSDARPSLTGAPGNDKRADDSAAGARSDFYDKSPGRHRPWGWRPKRMRATDAPSRRPPALNDDGSLAERSELASDGEPEQEDGVEVVDTASQAAFRPNPAGIVQAARETTKASLVGALARRRATHGRMPTSPPRAKGPKADHSTDSTEAQLIASQDALTEKAEAIDLTMDLAQVRCLPGVALHHLSTPAIVRSPRWSSQPPGTFQGH